MERKILVGFILLLCICLCIFLQVNFFPHFLLFGVSANIGLVLIVGVGLLSDKLPGALVGGAYGLLMDILFGKSIGIYFIIYGLAGFASGFFNKNVSKDNKLTFVYMTAIYTALVEMATYIIFMLIYGYSFEIFPAVLMILKEVLYNMFLARILFGFLSWLGEIINKSKNSYYLL